MAWCRSNWFQLVYFFKTKEIDIDPEKSKVVKRAFEMFAAGEQEKAVGIINKNI